MKLLAFLIFSLCAVSTKANNVNTSAQTSTVKVITAQNATLSPTTTAAQTTTQPKNTTTAQPTTQPQNTTTVQTTTQPKNTTTAQRTTQPQNTTTAQTTTQSQNTTAAQTTTPKTTITSTPSSVVEFVLKEGLHECLRLLGDISVTYSYVNASNVTESGTIHLIKTQNVNGTCSPLVSNTSKSSITINEKSVTVTFQFISDSQRWYLNSVSANVLKMISGNNSYDLKSNGGFYQASLNQSYGCDSEKRLSMIVAGKLNNASLAVVMKGIRMQPFNATEKYPNLSTCPADSNNNPDNSIVPIAVGCALAGLIVIVLIAYLIGRRKASNRGYQQV